MTYCCCLGWHFVLSTIGIAAGDWVAILMFLRFVIWLLCIKKLARQDSQSLQAFANYNVLVTFVWSSQWGGDTRSWWNAVRVYAIRSISERVIMNTIPVTPPSASVSTSNPDWRQIAIISLASLGVLDTLYLVWAKLVWLASTGVNWSQLESTGPG